MRAGRRELIAVFAAEDGRGRGALLSLAISLVLGLACAWAGRRLGMTL